METLTSTSTYHHTTLRICTERTTEFIDLTERLQELIADARIDIGFVNVQTLHTTTGVVVNELEPLLLTDFASLLERVAPQDASYRHDDAAVRTVNVSGDERINGFAHCR